MTPTDTRTRCPYKGATQQYWSFGEQQDIAWSYAETSPSAAGISGYVCFYDDKPGVNVELG